MYNSLLRGRDRITMKDMTLASVDFGCKKISVSLGRIAEEDIDILNSYSTKSNGIEKGFIVDEAKCCEDLKNAVNKLEVSTNHEITSIYAGISARDIRSAEISSSVNLTEGKVRGKDITRAIEKGKHSTILGDGEEIVDVIINFFNLDGKIVCENVTGWRSNILTINLTILIGKTYELDKYRRVIRNSNLLLKGFLINIVTGKKIFLNDKKSMGMKVLVDIGAGTSDIAIFNNGVLKYILAKPLGGDNLTKDLAICGNFSIAEAEKIKKIYSSNYETIYLDKEQPEIVEVGYSKISKELFYNVIKARLEEILYYVNLELKNTSFFEGICSIIIFGDGVTYYENVNSIAKDQIEKKSITIRKEDLGMKESSNITSLAIVKEVYDRLKLVYDDSTKVEIEKKDEKDENEKTQVKKKNIGFKDKLKGFLGDIF